MGKVGSRIDNELLTKSKHPVFTLYGPGQHAGTWKNLLVNESKVLFNVVVQTISDGYLMEPGGNYWNCLRLRYQIRRSL